MVTGPIFFTKNDPLLIRKLTYFSILNDSVEDASGNYLFIQEIRTLYSILQNFLYQELIPTGTHYAVVKSGKVR